MIRGVKRCLLKVRKYRTLPSVGKALRMLIAPLTEDQRTQIP